LVAAGIGRRRQGRREYFVAISTNAEKVAEFGIDTANMFEFWTGLAAATRWTRRSTFQPCWPSADHFRALLAGFHAIDEHFRTTP
jgi:glucose-6-phosphate isomerase